MSRFKNKEPGVLAEVWHQSGHTVVNTAGVAEQGTGFLKDSMKLGREVIKPSLVDAGVETLVAMAEGIAELVKLGVPEDQAETYLRNLIS